MTPLETITRMPARQIHARGLFVQLVDLLGEAIVGGRYAPGERLRPEQLCEGYGVSRTVVREALRVMETKGLTAARPNVGTTVRPIESWNWLDPDVLRWRREHPGSHQLDLDIAATAARVAGLHDDLHGNVVFEQLLEHLTGVRCERSSSTPETSEQNKQLREQPPTAEAAYQPAPHMGGTVVVFERVVSPV